MSAQTLTVEKLTAHRDGRPVLTDVSFDVGPGEIVAVIGPNGAGKTTLIHALLGVVQRTHGMVRSGAAALTSIRDWGQVASWMPDNAELPAEVRISTLWAHAVAASDVTAAVQAEILERMGLVDLLRVRAGELSHGEKKRVQLAMALCTRRPLVILDEPLAAFDPLQLRGVLAFLKDRARQGTALLVTVHQMSDAEKIADRVLLLARGGVVAFGSLEHLRKQAGSPGGTLEDLFVRLLEGNPHAAP